MSNLERYIKAAMAKAQYEILKDDGSLYGCVPECRGVWVNTKTLKACRVELREALRGWIKLGLRLGHKLPIIDGINLNKENDDGTLPLQ